MLVHVVTFAYLDLVRHTKPRSGERASKPARVAVIIHVRHKKPIMAKWHVMLFGVETREEIGLDFCDRDLQRDE